MCIMTLLVISAIIYLGKSLNNENHTKNCYTLELIESLLTLV